MSTKFTRLPFEPGVAPLLVLFGTANRWLTLALLDDLTARGYAGLTEAHLSLLANLDCGSTHAAALAHRTGISRQAMNRTIREMEALGYLRLDADPVRRNQKVIVMTDKGSDLALAARSAAARTEEGLLQIIGPTAFSGLRAALEARWGPAGTAAPGGAGR